ncbi:MAG: hypothetical protein JWL59_2650 [Chthoniobacteraceae bacterium]|nr:hypothetical protein [Chthoniobacteraceae bacterium]
MKLSLAVALLCFVRAASAATYTVTNNADSGAGSLRQTLADAADQAGADTLMFVPGMSGQTMTLASEIIVDDQGGVSIDASSLPAGVTISGNHATSIFSQPSASSTLTLRGLTLMNGYDKDGGGAIGNSGTLTLVQCMLSGNSAPMPARSSTPEAH